MKIKIFKVYERYLDYESYNTLVQGCVDWLEIDNQELQKYKEAISMANSLDSEFKYVLVEDVFNAEEIFNSAKEFLDGVAKQKAKDLEKQRLAREKREAEKQKSEEKKLEQKKKQLEKLKKELGEE